MDIRLPDIEGTDAVVQVRSDPRTATIPLVAVTSFATMGE
jgi:CheY-like chemotaxis protein